MDLTKCIVEINQPSSYSLPHSIIPALPMTSYLIGRSIACTVAYCAGLPMPSIKFESELNIITTKIKDILTTCSPALEEKRGEESYQALQHDLFNNSSNKSKVLKLILNAIDDNEISLSSRQYSMVRLQTLNNDVHFLLLL
ncbi:PREDICTED: uncharacterized protein LOC109180797 [Ipomoea nil]|uniref:uncharacterized protein LOC109180797 n=1 Tax=Ipomoea nil TaxID=35883 RepID=UPI00090195AC|nr:PREDICTED: uncharacterized protein LOC109180797 [Ipomoea nil]